MLVFADDFTRMLQDYGDAVHDKKRFLGLLRDFFPEQQMQVNLLQAAYDLDIVKELEGAQAIGNAFAFRFVKRLTGDYGISRRNADWAVSVWCVCYGQQVLHKSCEITLNGENDATTPAIRENKNPDNGRKYGDLFRYTAVKDGYKVSGFGGKDQRTLIFSNRYNGQPVKGICDRSFWGCAVQEIVLTDGMESIGNEAFSKCGMLKQVIFPVSLREIGDSAFDGCTELVTATLPEGLEQIGRFAFRSCALKNVKIPKSVYWMGEAAFAACEKLESVTVQDGMTALPDRLFQGCKLLKKVQLPENLEHIGSGVFAGCEALEMITVPDAVKDIGENAFTGTAKKFTLLCKQGSAAEKYAREHNITFQIVF